MEAHSIKTKINEERVQVVFMVDKEKQEIEVFSILQTDEFGKEYEFRLLSEEEDTDLNNILLLVCEENNLWT